MRTKLSPATKAVCSGALLICLAGSAEVEAKSDLFASLQVHHNDSGHGTYDLYNVNDGRLHHQVGQSISELIDDGFILDVGDDPEWSYIECQGYRVPLGDDNVMLRKPETIFQDGNFRIWITTDDECRLIRARGLSLEHTRL